MIKKLLSIACVITMLILVPAVYGMQKSKTYDTLLLSASQLKALTKKKKNELFVTAASVGNKGLFLQLLDAGAEIDAQSDEPLITALHGAAAKGDVEILNLLIARSAKIDVPNVSRGQTALFSAAFLGYEKAVEVLLDAGAHIEATDLGGNTPLHVACGIGNAEVVKLLLERKASVHVRATAEPVEGYTPLHAAAEANHAVVIALLLMHGADTEARNAAGHTALHVAAIKGNAEAAQCLLTRNASAEACDVIGNLKPLHYAAGAGHLAVVRVFLQNKVNPAPMNGDNVTPLMVAEQRGHAAVARLLRDAIKSTLGCTVCGKTESAELKLSCCGRCTISKYCSKDCQKADWKEHKQLCEAKIHIVFPGNK